MFSSFAAGLCLFAKRLERGKFVWTPLVDGTMTLTPAPRVVALSSMGANRTSGLGMITALSLLEQGFCNLGFFDYRPERDHFRATGFAFHVQRRTAGPVQPDFIVAHHARKRMRFVIFALSRTHHHSQSRPNQV
jgi:hypothetical protein